MFEFEFPTGTGSSLVDPTGPVAHVSYFEADAFATWSGKRLPSETEWEVATQRLDVDGNFLDLIRVRPWAARVHRCTQPAGAVQVGRLRPINSAEGNLGNYPWPLA